MQHHAILYIASSLETAPLPPEVRAPSADVDHIVVDRCSIDTVRYLIEVAHRTPLEAPTRELVLVAARVTTEAQHALLKVLEEPPERTRFSLVVPSESHLLPTVRSRLHYSAAPNRTEANGVGAASAAEVTTFLASSYSERLRLIEDRVKRKDTETLRPLLVALGVWVSEHRTAVKISPEAHRAVHQAVLESAQSGASLKMLCEHVAVLLPIVEPE